jgi:hypothetical protein
LFVKKKLSEIRYDKKKTLYLNIFIKINKYIASVKVLNANYTIIYNHKNTI